MAVPIIMPRQGQSVESCILTEWKVSIGDEVSEGEVLAVIETDKASFDLESTSSGQVLALFWEEEDDVPVLANVAVIGAEGENWEEFLPPKSGSGETPIAGEDKDSSPQEVSLVTEESRTPEPGEFSNGIGIAAGISPRARKLADRMAISIEDLQGTGPGGRIIERDIRSFAKKRPRLSPVAAVMARENAMNPPFRGSGLAGMALGSDMRRPGAIEGAEVEPVRGIRKVIAERMMKSLSSTAQLTLHSFFELTAVQILRKQRLEEGKPKVSINDLIAHGLLEAIQAHPEMNAHFLGDKMAIFEKVHLGVAVDTPRGLMVPVVRNASDLSLEDLSGTIGKAALQCREGSLSPDDLTGGSFTLTNLGMLGVETFTPVLNAPEVAILGVGGIVLRPKRLDSGEIVFADFLPLSLTIDHQAVDGAPAARFLQTLVNHMEKNPGGKLSQPNEPQP